MLLKPLEGLVKAFVEHCFSGDCKEFGLEVNDIGCVCRCTWLKVATLFKARSVYRESAFVLEN